MRERLEELMQLLNLNPTQFANAIGVQRATLQHILSGRNEPSLKIIMAIHASFPDVELEWLLNGKGSAIPQLQQNEPVKDDYPLLPGMESLFFKDVEPVQEGDFSYKDKRIKEVVVFFADGTYQKFSSELKK